MRKYFQLRLRTVLLLMATVAAFLAWRVRDPERHAVAAIEQAGGRVHFNYQGPGIATSWFSVAMLPDYRYFSQIRVVHQGDAEPRRLNVAEFLLGSNTDRRVGIVELDLEAITPGVISHLEGLSELHMLIVDMPAGMVHRDSEENQRLAKLNTRFAGKVYPACNLDD